MYAFRLRLAFAVAALCLRFAAAAGPKTSILLGSVPSNGDSIDVFSRSLFREQVAQPSPPHKGNPGLKIRLSPSGLRYANRIAGSILNQGIADLHFPDNIETQAGPWELTIKEMSIAQFQPPEYKYRTYSPNRLVWESSGGRLALPGKWNAKMPVLTGFWTKNGEFTAMADNIEVTMSARFVNSAGGKPQISEVQCTSKIWRLILDIDGGVFGTILNLFREKIAQIVKPRLEKALCMEAKRLVERDMNAKLRTFPTVLSLSDKFNIDFSLTENPRMVGGSIETKHRGEVRHVDSESGSSFFAHGLGQEFPDGKMLYLWASDYVINTFLEQAHKEGEITYTLNNDTAPELSRYFSMSCEDLCFGKIFPATASEYPDHLGVVEIYSTQAPKIHFHPDSAFMDGLGVARFYAQPTNGGGRTFLFSALVNGSAVVSMHLKSDETEQSVAGTAQVQQLTASLMKSQVKGLTDANLQTLTDLLKPIIENVTNRYLDKGIPIPLTRGIYLSNPTLTIQERKIQLAADLDYTHGQFVRLMSLLK